MRLMHGVLSRHYMLATETGTQLQACHYIVLKLHSASVIRPCNFVLCRDVQFQGEGLRKINKCVWICALLIYGRPCQIQTLNWVLLFAPFSEVAFSVELLRWTFPTTDGVVVDKVSWGWKWVMLCNGFQVTQQIFEAPAKCIKSGFLEVEPALLQPSFQVQV